MSAEGRTRLDFEERPGLAPGDQAPIDPATRDQLEREELHRRLVAVEHERDDLVEQLARLSQGFRWQRRAWQLAKVVIAEKFGGQTGNLIRQGIETQVERELGAGPPEE